MQLTIKIKGNRAYFYGDLPMDTIQSVSSFQVKGHQYSPSYKKGFWDGWCRLFDKKSNSFPIGLLDQFLLDVPEEYNINIEPDQDHQDLFNKVESKDTDFIVHGIPFGQGIYSYQLDVVNKVFYSRRGIIKVATGGSKTELASSLIKKIEEPTLFIAPGVDLLHQSRERIAKRLGLSLVEVGIIGDSEYYISDWVTVASPDTLSSRLKDKDLQDKLKNFWKVLFVDEVHYAGASTWYEVIDSCKAPYRFGLSATPMYRTDEASLRLIAQMGNVIVDINTKDLIEKGVLCKPYLEMYKIKEPKLSSKLTWHQVHEQGIVNNKILNNFITSKCDDLSKQNLRTVVIVQQIKQGEILEKSLKDIGLKAKFIYGNDSSEVRKHYLDEFNKNNLQFLIGSNILSTGVDTPHIDCLVFADSGESKIQVIQRVGRGLRKKPGKEKVLIIDFLNATHKFLLKHSIARLETYKEEDCYDIKILE